MPLPITLTAHDQPVQALIVPTSWADVTLSQYVALFAPVAGERRTVAEVLLSLKAGALGQLAADDVVYLANLLEFASDPSSVLDLLPPSDLRDPGTQPWGCLVLCQEHFTANEERPALACLPYVLAVYRCQTLYGNTDRLEEVLAQVLAAPVTEVYAEGAFFLAAAQRLRSGTSQTKATSTTPPTKNSTPAVRSWLRGLGLRWPWTRWPVAT